jgi:hypothetical protein
MQSTSQHPGAIEGVCVEGTVRTVGVSFDSVRVGLGDFDEITRVDLRALRVESRPPA